MLICLDQRTGTGCGAQNRDGAQHCSACGRPLRFALQLQNPGAAMGNYRIVRLIGHGGFGAVYEAEDLQSPGLHVALKETFDPDSIRSFQGEFAVLHGLQHPNLPRYYEMFEEQGNGYLAMEFVPGQSLQDVLDSQPGQALIESQVLGYAMQICDALSYLHSQNPAIIHRDVKPANIRITPAGLIKLVDFGLLKQGTGTTRTSLRGAGTPEYAPIEQYGTGALHTDARSDIYSFGATLYHLLSGRLPVEAQDRVGVVPDPLAPLARLNPQVSVSVARTVMTAVNVFQKDRFPDVKAMKQALIGAGGQVTNTPPPPTRKSPPTPLRLTNLFLFMTGILGLAAWGMGAIGILSGILMRFGKRWGRRISMAYLPIGIFCLGFLELIFFDEACQPVLNCDSSNNCTIYYRGQGEYALLGGVLAIVVTFGIYAFLTLTRDDVLDFIYPQDAPHRKGPGRLVAIVAWTQILAGFWLVFPAVLAIGLLYRKRIAYQVNRVIAVISTLLSVPLFLIGLAIAAGVPGGFIVPAFAHLTFLVNSMAWYVLTRPEVDALF